MKLTLFQALPAANGAPVATRATCTITTVAKANIVDGETFYLFNHRGEKITFEFDTNGVVVAGNVRVDISADVTADNVRDRIIGVIGLVAVDNKFGFYSISGGAGAVTVTQDDPGPQGNQATGDTVANGGFSVTAFTGGVLSGVPLRDASRALVKGESMRDLKQAGLWIQSTAATTPASLASARWWGYSLAASPRTRDWVPLGNGPGATKGRLNNGAAIDETSAGKVRHTETVYQLDAIDLVYLQLGAFTNVTAVDAWLAGDA